MGECSLSLLESLDWILGTAKIHTDIHTNTHKSKHRTKITEQIGIRARVENVPSMLGLYHSASLMENHLGPLPNPKIGKNLKLEQMKDAC